MSCRERERERGRLSHYLCRVGSWQCVSKLLFQLRQSGKERQREMPQRNGQRKDRRCLSKEEASLLPGAYFRYLRPLVCSARDGERQRQKERGICVYIKQRDNVAGAQNNSRISMRSEFPYMLSTKCADKYLIKSFVSCSRARIKDRQGNAAVVRSP